MATSRFFAIDERIICYHLETPTARWDQGQGFNAGCVAVGEFFRQTDGTGRIVSRCTIFDAEFELLHLSLSF